MLDKKWVGLLVLMLVFGMTVVGCTSTAGLPSNFGDKGLPAGQNESEIIVQRPKAYAGSAAAMNVFIDSQLRLTLRNAESGMVIVPNGNHTIYAEMVVGGEGWVTNKTVSENIHANSTRITFVLVHGNQLALKKTSEVALRSSSSE